MKKSTWIWFAGFAAWIIDGLANISIHNWLHARVAFTIAMFFLAAALFYRRQT